MAFPKVVGHPEYGSTGTSKFIPEIWSGKLQKKFYDATVLAAISNTDYEGEIKNQGDKVIIRSTASISIKDYAKGQKLDYERPESPSLELLIDKAKYFAFAIDRIDKYQADIGLMDNWSGDASEQMKISIDTDVLAAIYNQGSSTNLGTAAGRISQNVNLGAGTGSAGFALTKVNIVDKIVEAGQCLDENNVPENDRFFIVPAWAVTRIKTSDLKDASMTGDGKSILRNGRIGMIDRFTVYSSNLLYSASDGTRTCWNMIFGQTSALTFASQITEMETLKAESTFGDMIRGLNVFGYKVIKPEAMGTLVAYPA